MNKSIIQTHQTNCDTNLSFSGSLSFIISIQNKWRVIKTWFLLPKLVFSIFFRVYSNVSSQKCIDANCFTYFKAQFTCHTYKFIVYTDTDTVSVCIPYWHSVSAARTQTSHFRSTTTLRDTQIIKFLKNFLLSCESLKFFPKFMKLNQKLIG